LRKFLLSQTYSLVSRKKILEKKVGEIFSLFEEKRKKKKTARKKHLSKVFCSKTFSLSKNFLFNFLVSFVLFIKLE